MSAPTLQISPSLSEDGKTLTITELTGAYSALNITGWGAPNYTTGSATIATIAISKRNSDGTYSSLPLSPINVYPTLPSSVNGTVTITAAQAGLGTSGTFADGIYLITYTVTGNSGGAYTISTNFYWGNIASGECCYKNAAVKVSTCACNCEDLQQNLINLRMFLSLYCVAEEDGNLNQMQLFIDKISRLCSQCGCGCS